MNKYAVYCIIILACSSELEIICRTLCKSDGDDASFTIKGVCYCANKRDVNKFIMKIPRNMEINTLKKPNYYEE